MGAASLTPGHDAKVLGLIGTGHFLSHFYLLALPPLFPLLKAEYGVNYTTLGLALTIFYLATGTLQVPVGFLVDRIGARPVLIAGLALEAGSIGLIGLASSYWVLLILTGAAGAGHSVFHPADYSILSSSVDQNRMGRAFSVHTFAGHLGSAAAPATMISLATLGSWRLALIVTGIFGILVAAVMILQSRVLKDDTRPEKKPEERAKAQEDTQGNPSLLSVPMVMFFLFFTLTATIMTGIQAFSVTAVTDLHGNTLASANSALTGFLLASAVGVLAGGFIADRTSRHNLVAAAAFALTAAIIFSVGAVGMASLLLIAALTVAGFAQGVIRPTRDMMVRAAAPRGSTGKVFGFVSTGVAAGGVITPVLFGWIIDQGHPGWVFGLLGILAIIGLVTVLIPERSRTA